MSPVVTLLHDISIRFDEVLPSVLKLLLLQSTPEQSRRPHSLSRHGSLEINQGWKPVDIACSLCKIFDCFLRHPGCYIDFL
ncbi:hypothetical protein scyTo_0006094 [Scyliorhinus torazame]|uniref:Uncharacterized protein n=1 Tax=Scyliorhinus torazame TaxID=75743 RepID=A0A401PFH4_SCYTO|nr:hypothetical protein [Scyliorhinus torazame]